MKPPRRHRALTTGEARLWREVAKLVTPLRGRPEPDAPAPPPPEPAPVMPARLSGPKAVPVPAAKPAKRTPPKFVPPPARTATAMPYQAPPQRPLPADGLERQVRLALRRGRQGIEARLDLHGMIQSEAHAALTGFLLRSRAAGHGYVLIVTGKGGEGYADPFGERGVLRRSVPHWLRSAELRHFVIGFEEASRHHGGGGALYVRLRRR
ncbi:Smr/MutS family protein [Methylobacterium sp. J-076]|uniref:Smr/MutS family protein n=1 Tax=Methylobacterium sp. J-076 TaxID=2836655 RepID=UPI001FB8F65E|nr:Smr/MutS family protein [Methylobacterium sp. J-076]MCJ2014863.1 Smr/MutS family protein [Methylobacterium sp. J-076]